MANINDLISREFGADVRVDDNPLTTDIDTTAKEIWRQDPNRIGLLFVNLSANDVFFNIRPDVSTTNGIQLVGSGDSLVLSWKEDLILPSLSWYALSDVNNSTILSWGVLLQ